jgi:hypothetical protein
LAEEYWENAIVGDIKDRDHQASKKQDAYCTIICAKRDDSEFWVASAPGKFNLRKHYRIFKFLGTIEQVPASIPGSAPNSQFRACL